MMPASIRGACLAVLRQQRIESVHAKLLWAPKGKTGRRINPGFSSLLAMLVSPIESTSKDNTAPPASPREVEAALRALCAVISSRRLVVSESTFEAWFLRPSLGWDAGYLPVPTIIKEQFRETGVEVQARVVAALSHAVVSLDRPHHLDLRLTVYRAVAEGISSMHGKFPERSWQQRFNASEYPFLAALARHIGEPSSEDTPFSVSMRSDGLRFLNSLLKDTALIANEICLASSADGTTEERQQMPLPALIQTSSVLFTCLRLLGAALPHSLAYGGGIKRLVMDLTTLLIRLAGTKQQAEESTRRLSSRDAQLLQVSRTRLSAGCASTLGWLSDRSLSDPLLRDKLLTSLSSVLQSTVDLPEQLATLEDAPFGAAWGALMGEAIKDASVFASILDLPDEFICAITYELLDDPVVIPQTNTVVNRDSIVRVITESGKNPFNNQPLSEDDLLPPPEGLTARIAAWRREMRQSQ
eukprot:gnl/Dysnectes_brevis/8246_a14522_224.p1 GENE.gnl/Dysnectes_brevis/8246_a14522_224~~gnl/Dysnectes_brevis/8246_a14522_224.p1  ORF type:complete len:471 (+),score=166.60 gnl/Dysnectes_brevis/8246_a14522_224:3-1415(+)